MKIQINPILFTLIILTVISCTETSNEIEGLQVPEGFTIEQAVKPGLTSYPYFATFGPDGKLFVFESDGTTTSTEEMTKNPSFSIKILEDEDEDGVFDKAHTYADKLTFPMGGTFYQGSLYVAVPPQLIKLTDTNKDGVADKKEVILEGWVFYHNAALLSGPFFGPDGWMYLADARRSFEIVSKEGDTLKGKGARIWRCRPDGTGLESVAGGGFDNAVELVFMPSGETIGTMTYYIDPQGGQRDALMHWVEGGVYPKPHAVIAADSLTLTGGLMPVMTKFGRVSPSGLALYQGRAFGEAYERNLFSAQFNTGRVMRHIVFPDGATYYTEDEPFMESKEKATHPTDVLQDADGSLLIINTGGWFIAGCPLSRMAKADDKGGIYRIRKTDTRKNVDPWGKSIDVETMDIKTLTGLLSDPRNVVIDRAVERLVFLGKQSVNDVTKVLHQSKNVNERVKSAFILGRINTKESRKALILGLNDNSKVVRTAICRMLGLSQETAAVDALMKIVINDAPSVRRQAATALGQIGDTRAIEALLEAAVHPKDRMVEHAIIYALISLGEPKLLIEALEHPSNDVRNVALIALDQMEENPLEEKHLAPFLNTSEDSVLSQNSLWVLSHHPEWDGLLTTFLTERFSHAPLTPAEKEIYRDLLISFSASPKIQKLIVQILNQQNLPTDTRAMMLETMANASLLEFPDQWMESLSFLLLTNNEPLKMQTLEVVLTRGIAELDDELNKIIKDNDHNQAFRLKALSAKISHSPTLTKGEFDFIYKLLSPDTASPTQRTAVHLLDQASLSTAQLLFLAEETIIDADPLLLPALVNVFQGDSTTEVGNTLFSTLQKIPKQLESLSHEDIQTLAAGYPEKIKKQASPILTILQEKQTGRLAVLEDLSARLESGDVENGRKLFFGKSICYSCHAVAGEGSAFGPDLSNIGEIRSRHDILEAILYPSVSFAREYESSKITTNNASYMGIIKEQTPEVIYIETSIDKLKVRVPVSDITSIEQVNTSLMPPGLDKMLTEKELADLMAFLESLPDGLAHLTQNKH